MGSGTSGGTLAPLLTIGGAAGAAIGAVILMVFPRSGINIPMAALIGMSSMFAGASRAYLTSITFALEATMQSHALLPLLGACTASYLVSFFLMENTIMTEKIARRGVATPDSFEPDILQKLTVDSIVNENGIVLSNDLTVQEAKDAIAVNKSNSNYFVVVNEKGTFVGTMALSALSNPSLENSSSIMDIIINSAIPLRKTDSLRKAVALMETGNTDVLPVLSLDRQLTGIISYRDILSAYNKYVNETEDKNLHISLKRNRQKIMVHGRSFRK